jgi:cyclophilin family peptidyl-prolyl cis-trans isomerase
MKKIVLVMFLVFYGLINAQTLARWETSMGDFTAELCDTQAPITTENFISLARSGFYDNLIFHRVIEGFMIQDGCPLGTGYGGPGYTIEDEFDTGLLHDRAGTLAMAHTSQPNSAGSQYYITVNETPHLDNAYAVFGYVIEGLDVVLDISHVPTTGSPNDKPLEDVNIYSVRVSDFYISNKIPAEDEIEASVDENLSFAVTANITVDNTTLDYTWFVNGEEVTDPNYQDFYFSYSPVEAGVDSIACAVADSNFTIVTSWNLNVSSVNNDDNIVANKVKLYQNYPNPFNIQENRSSATAISFEIRDEKKAVVEIYNIIGQKVNEIVKTDCHDGINSVIWNGTDFTGNLVQSGVYLYKLKTENISLAKKTIVIR